MISQFNNNAQIDRNVYLVGTKDHQVEEELHKSF